MKAKPITPEEMRAWIDATWEKCQSEAWKEPRQWVGLTEDEAFACRGRDYFETYKNIEAKLKEKNT